MRKKGVLGIALLAFAATVGLRSALQFIERTRPLTLGAVTFGGAISAVERSLRPNYPYSVIPGGAYSPEELRNSLERDKIVRDHYADFDLKSARLVTLTDDRLQYVSFRVKSKTYWTRSKLRIPKGESLLTHGVHFAGTRCGNRLSNSRPEQSAFALPSTRLLSLPAFSPRQLASGELAVAPTPLIADASEGLEFPLPEIEFLLPRTPEMAAPLEKWPPINILPLPPPLPIPGSPREPVTLNTPAALPFPTPESAIPTVFTSPPISADVPQPGSLYLFIVTLAVSFWVITRWIRNEQNPVNNPTEDES